MFGPGRFLMPGDLAGSPALTFAPLALPADGEPPPGSAWAMMRRRYDAYRDAVVRPFFRDHFARLDRQIVLVDVLAALDAGPDAVRDLQDAMAAVLDCFRLGRGGWLNALFAPRADRILFAATKADQLHHSAHDRLEAILKQMTEGAIARAGDAGAEVESSRWPRCARRARRCFAARAAGLPSIVGTAVPGEWADGRHFDGTTEMAFFPGDLPGRELAGRRFPLDPVPAAGAGRDRRRHSGAAAHSPRPRAAIPDRGPAAMTEALRKPAVFSVDDPRLVVAEPDEVQRAGRLSDAAEAPADNRPGRGAAPRPDSLGHAVLVGAVRAGADGLGLAVTNLVEDLFARAPWLGAIGLALAVIAGLALLVVVIREIVGLARLATVEALRDRAVAVIESDDRDGGRVLVVDMLALTQRIPRLARARARLEEHGADIIDGRDLVRLAERELMSAAGC